MSQRITGDENNKLCAEQDCLINHMKWHRFKTVLIGISAAAALVSLLFNFIYLIKAPLFLIALIAVIVIDIWYIVSLKTMKRFVPAVTLMLDLLAAAGSIIGLFLNGVGIRGISELIAAILLTVLEYKYYRRRKPLFIG